MGHFVRIDERVVWNPDKLAKANLFTSDRMFCDVYCLLPGQAQKPHSHAESDKIYVVLEGQVVVAIGGEERTLGPGEAGYCAPGLEHGLRNEASMPAKVLVFMTPKP